MRFTFAKCTITLLQLSGLFVPNHLIHHPTRIMSLELHLHQFIIEPISHPIHPLVHTEIVEVNLCVAINMDPK